MKSMPRTTKAMSNFQVPRPMSESIGRHCRNPRHIRHGLIARRAGPRYDRTVPKNRVRGTFAALALASWLLVGVAWARSRGSLDVISHKTAGGRLIRVTSAKYGLAVEAFRG